MPLASVAKDSAVFEAAATRATKAAIAPVLAVLVADVDGAAGDVGSPADEAAPPAFNVGAEVAQRPDVDDAVVLDECAEALEDAVAPDGASEVGAGAGVDQRPDVDVLDGANVGVGVEAEPVALADVVPTVDVGAAGDGRLAEGATAGAGDEAFATELPGRVGRGGGFAAGGGDAAGAGRAGGTGGIAAFEIGLLTVAVRGVAVAAGEVAGRLAPGGPPAVAPAGSWGGDEAECSAEADGCGVCEAD